jgi:sialate O-acetylesterase
MRAFVFSSLILPLFAQSVEITKGASDYQVYQRSGQGTADLNLEGRAHGADGKAVEARLVSAVTGFDVVGWNPIGKASGQTWSGAVKAVPAGGPYRLEVRVAGSSEAATVSDLLVGDLWILAGQSNMEGVGNLDNLPPSSALVNSFDQTDHWVVALDPLHRLPDAADRVHWRLDPSKQPEKLEGAKLEEFVKNRKKGSGAGMPFALEMVRRTGVPIGLVPCAHGGTSMDQWSPSLKDKGGDSLYGQMIRRHQRVGGRVRGVLWYQGESDANPNAAPLFEEKFKQFVAAVRTDFGQPDLIGRHISSQNVAEWNLVQDAQRRLEAAIPNAGMVTCVDCNLDDGIHVGTDDHRLLGKRLANLACHDLFPSSDHCGSLKKGPRPASAKLDGSIVRVEFAEVNGRLTHVGRLNGFTIHDDKGAALPLIYRQRVDSHQANVVELLIGGKVPPRAVLWYGNGKDPYVNLRDEAGMASPVFGPLPIAQ